MRKKWMPRNQGTFNLLFMCQCFKEKMGKIKKIMIKKKQNLGSLTDRVGLTSPKPYPEAEPFVVTKYN